MRNKKSIALFSAKFLSISMTFIYRQLKGLQTEFDFSVFTEKIEHEEIFSFEPIYEVKRDISLIKKFLYDSDRVLHQQYIKPTKEQTAFWSYVIRRENIHLIHAHFGVGGLQMLPIAQKMNIPLVTTFHGYDASRLLRSKLYRNHLTDLFEYSHIIAVSDIMREKLINLGADRHKTYRHYIGVPVTEFNPSKKNSLAEKLDNNETIVFLQVSNFIQKKGHVYTLEAFSNHLSEYPNSKLILAGGGPLLADIVQYSTTLGIDDKVDFVGPVEKWQVIRLMNQADIFVHHSVTSSRGDQEGIPTVIMEAMAMNLPILSTNHAGIPELVREGIDGYLVDERDVASYTESMKAILSLTKRSSREWIEDKFNLEKNNHVLGNIYMDIIDGPQ